MSARARAGQFVAIRAADVDFHAERHLTLRFCEPPWQDGPALRIGFMFDKNDDEVCWLDRAHAKVLLAELQRAYGEDGR